MDLLNVGFEDVAEVVIVRGKVQAECGGDLPVGHRHTRVARGDQSGQQVLVGGRGLVDADEDPNAVGE
jgi:hypothetical protein